MKIHRVVFALIDFDDIGAEGVQDVLENTRYANDCMSPSVISIETRDIGEWSDIHPLNNSATAGAELKRLFGNL